MGVENHNVIIIFEILVLHIFHVAHCIGVVFKNVGFSKEILVCWKLQASFFIVCKR